MEVRLTRLHEDLPFPEGPTFDAAGTLFVCVRKSGYVARIAADGSRSRHLEIDGQPNATAFGPDGRLYVTDYRHGRLLAVERDGTVTTVVAEYEGVPMIGLNDLAFDAAGVLYFTDSEHSLAAVNGAVYRRSPTGEVVRIASGLRYSNGIVVTPDGAAVFVSETAEKRITLLSRKGDGTYAARPFCRTEGGIGPDGMARRPDGSLYVANHGSGMIDVFDAGGALIAQLPAGGEKPTNCTFHRGSLYVTEDETASVWRLDPVGEGSAWRD